MLSDAQGWFKMHSLAPASLCCLRNVRTSSDLFAREFLFWFYDEETILKLKYTVYPHKRYFLKVCQYAKNYCLLFCVPAKNGADVWRYFPLLSSVILDHSKLFQPTRREFIWHSYISVWFRRMNSWVNGATGMGLSLYLKNNFIDFQPLFQYAVGRGPDMRLRHIPVHCSTG